MNKDWFCRGGEKKSGLSADITDLPHPLRRLSSGELTLHTGSMICFRSQNTVSCFAGGVHDRLGQQVPQDQSTAY